MKHGCYVSIQLRRISYVDSVVHMTIGDDANYVFSTVRPSNREYGERARESKSATTAAAAAAVSVCACRRDGGGVDLRVRGIDAGIGGGGGGGDRDGPDGKG